MGDRFKGPKSVIGYGEHDGRAATEWRICDSGWRTGYRNGGRKQSLSLAGKLHHAEYVVRPGRYFVRRLLRLANPHLTGESREGEGTRGADFGGRQRRRGD